jgi:NAD(P)H-flavin reductase
VLGYFADAMKTAAAQDARDQPAWWIGEIVQHDRRSPTIAVLTIRPDRPLKYEPGQYVTVQVPKWPRLWRRYSIANAPRENGLLDIHVRAVPGGMVSTALVGHSGTGDILTLAAAGGDLRVPADPERDLVCVAGGTGLAPIKAIVEAVVGELRQGKRREITLYVGARRNSDLYDMRDLATLRLAYPALTLVPVVEDELEGAGQVGRLPDIVKSHPSFRNTEVYLAGPASMISATRRTLSVRVPSDRFHHDPLDVLVAASRPVAILRSASDHLRG